MTRITLDIHSDEPITPGALYEKLVTILAGSTKFDGFRIDGGSAEPLVESEVADFMTKAEKRADLEKCIRLLKSRAGRCLRMGDEAGSKRATEATNRFQAQLDELR